MSDEVLSPDDTENAVTEIKGELVVIRGARRRKYGRFIVSALSSLPWIGGFLGASAALHAEADQGRIDDLQRLWLEKHQEKFERVGETLQAMMDRLEQLGEHVEERLSDDSFLALVEQGFRTWNDATTEEKREYIRRILTNAAGTTICSDDVVRLFLDWIERYHEAHFAVIKQVFKSPGATRAEVWRAIHGADVREDSAEADLFKLLYRELSMGGVIRQIREKSGDGQFVKKSATRPRVSNPYMKSAFDDVEQYELTELGAQFVHYTMNDIVPRISEPPSNQPSS
jgi:hypothetical protein